MKSDYRYLGRQPCRAVPSRGPGAEKAPFRWPWRRRRRRRRGKLRRGQGEGGGGGEPLIGQIVGQSVKHSVATGNGGGWRPP